MFLEIEEWQIVFAWFVLGFVVMLETDMTLTMVKVGAWFWSY